MNLHEMLLASKLVGGGGGGSGGGGGGGDNFPIGDGNTHILVDVLDERKAVRLVLGAVSGIGTSTIDWGDGSEPTVGHISAGSMFEPTHEYSSGGEYVISIQNEGNTQYFAAGVLTVEAGDMAKSGKDLIKKIELSEKIDRLVSKQFEDSRGLRSVFLPANLLYISANAFQNCTTITEISIPAGVSQIANFVFSGCVLMKCVDLSKHTAVPALSSTLAFNGVPTDCIFKIPAALYDEWIAATNWSAIAARNAFVGV